jgi:hypothetical protein
MNNWIDYTFAWFWEYTKLTFRLIVGLIRFIVWLVSSILNIRGLRAPKDQSDLFNQGQGKR